MPGFPLPAKSCVSPCGKDVLASRNCGIKDACASGKVVCACCGATYGAKVWHSTDKYRKTVYRCNDKYEDERCASRTVTEEEVKEAVAMAVRKLSSDKSRVLEDVRLMQKELCDTTALEREKEELERALARTDHALETLIYDNARRAQDQEKYNRRFGIIQSEYDKAMADAVRVGREIERRKKKSLELVALARALEAEYDDRPLMALVDKVVVGDGIKVVFKNGEEVVC